MVRYHSCGMTCRGRFLSFTFCTFILVIVLFYIELNFQPQINGARIKARWYQIQNEYTGDMNTVSNDDLNITFINVFNASKNKKIQPARNHSEVTTTVYKYDNHSMPWPVLQTTKEADNYIRSKVHIVIVVSYMRSGSTLTADIMQHFPKTLYVFEPFHQLYIRTRNGLPMHYLDGTFKKLTQDDITDEFLKNELMKWIDCRYWELDIHSLTDTFHAQFSRSMQQVYKCFIGKPRTIEMVRKCIPDAIEKCQKVKHRLFKFIRLPMRVVRSIFPVYPNLQVVHLVRDPRGSLTSQINLNVTSWGEIDSASRRFCHRVADDLNSTLYLNYFFPHRSKILIYEKLAENPLETAKKLFTYIDMPSYSYVLRYISKLTMEGRQGKNPFGYFRKNSTKTAYNWRDSVDLDHVQTIDNNCEMIYNFLGFKKFTNFADLRDHNQNTLDMNNHSIYIAT
ncbi:sulfotransferase 1 [Mactra antiquata]